MLKPFLISMLLVPLLFAGTAFADSFTYTNDRFGTSASLPADFYSLQGSENGDGRLYQSDFYHGEIRIYGSYNHAGDRFSDYRAFETDIYSQDSTITYEAGGKGWFVLSGWKGEDVYYLRVEGCDTGPMHHMYFQYPGYEKSRWEPIVNAYAKTLNGPCE
ncbi:hypothetical protein [uncultured Cohaesibacter sp.]|uniref:hypothetical protein n=1 Tax=uncultured Cohaesibacter sp. TaxID=1002546 RepID=UPI0029C6220F|nr:hypothetical protein [uncultured Cohaesibacter sp.]